MPAPTEELWRKVAAGFKQQRNFPNCIGALDGTHVVIQKPAGSGSLFFNYKGTFSIVLLALVDHHYNFIAVDVGAYGSNSDGGIFSNSNLGKSLDAGILHVPPPAPLPDAPELGSLPYAIVADDAFPKDLHHEALPWETPARGKAHFQLPALQCPSYGGECLWYSDTEVACLPAADSASTGHSG